MSACKTVHRPVLLAEVLDLLNVRQGGTYIDATLGGGGHALAILEGIGSRGFLLGIDRDREAVRRARRRLAAWHEQARLVRGNFGNVGNAAKAQHLDRVDGVLLDLGVSSDQLGNAERGFSFVADGPLDMRMDTSMGETAFDIVNAFSEEKLCAVLRSLGEEPRARQIARAIVRERSRQPITTTGQLAALVERAARGRRGRRHPATRTFQALRIAVNNELEELQQGLEQGVSLLRDGGRMAVIGFHSLEDRIVKRFFAAHVGKWTSLQGGGREWTGERPCVALVNRKPVTPSREEQVANPRARSAKLRVAERLAL